TEMVTTTMRNQHKKVVDNVTRNNGLLTVLKERGNIQTEGGGYEISRPLSYAENQTYQRYSGYDTLNIGASDVLSAAKYDWAQAALHVTASGRELRMNSSEEAMIKLVKARTDVAMATAANNMSVDIYSDGALSNQIGGLAQIITADGTGTVGGINASTYTFWRNKFGEIAAGGGTAITFANLKAAMNTQWLSQTRGNDKPDLIVFSHDLYSIYEGGLQDLQRYSDSKMASAGFEALKYKTSSVIFDDNTNYGTTAELGYFLNTRYLYLIEHEDAKWTEDDEKVPTNQDAVLVPIYWMGQVVCTNRSLQGRIHDLT
ncbi:MAG: phage major capsid protein, partial [Betaproteobacteria bacterium]|nr:phage major capsid protein [Betaproteobacteria bacterium]